MLDRVVVDVVHLSPKTLLAPDDVLPLTPLPKAAFPSAAGASIRACSTGSPGAANGSLSIGTQERAGPATSTPSQKLEERRGHSS